MDQIALPYPYTEGDIARGYTLDHGSQGGTRKRPIPADILLVIELRRLNALLAAHLAPPQLVVTAPEGQIVTPELMERLRDWAKTKQPVVLDKE